ncbi:MAG: DnaD domain protein, partial [Clostridia bacterium]|nr:DnaD domain protein [Clostridia bacterium]
MMTNNQNQYDNQQQYDQQEYYYQEQQKNHDDYYNNNYNIQHGAGRVPNLLLPSDMENIREAYVDNIGEMTGAVAKLIEKAISHGLTAREVIMAIEETGMAARPTPWYLKAILESWAENGVTVSKLRREVQANSARLAQKVIKINR